MPQLSCSHIHQIKVVRPEDHLCEDCVEIGEQWLHLRMCLTCGHIGCCDSSPNKHASEHFRATTHPLIRSAQPGETWTWCYVDRLKPGELPA
jgi:uncharacterized UBP type Zn finger protein